MKSAISSTSAGVSKDLHIREINKSLLIRYKRSLIVYVLLQELLAH